MQLWDVRYGNYEPAEVDSVHGSRESAEKRLAELTDGWEIIGPYQVGPPSLTEILKEAAEHGETEAGRGHGIGCACMDDAARKVRALIMAAITPAKRQDLTPEEIRLRSEDGDPEPDTWRYLPGEWEREMNQRMRISNILRMAVNRL